MKTLPLTEISILAPFVAALEELGAPTSRLLGDQNLSREMLDRGRGKITKRQLYQFLSSAGIPDLGYQVGARHGMRFIGPVGQSVLRSATLLDAINTFGDHLSRWMDGKQFWIEPAGKNVWLCNQARDGMEDLQEQANQCSLMTLISLIREVAGPAWIPTKIRVHQPENQTLSPFPLLAETTVEHSDCGIAILFPAEFLSRRLPELQGKPSALSGPRAGPQQIIPALEETLRDQLAFIGFPTIEQTADISGCSTRTLQRKLSEDGLTYQRLSDRIRFQVARDRLESDPSLTIGELSYDLGYASPSGFIRAFRRIAGMTPASYRETRNWQQL